MNIKFGKYKETRAPQIENSVKKQNFESHRDEKKEVTDILMCFDSNGKHIDRRKVWKVNKSVYKRCSNIFDVSKLIENEDIKELR